MGDEGDTDRRGDNGMNIKRAKQEIKDSIEAYLKKDAFGAYLIPVIRQRPILLMGPPGIGKTQVMEQIAKECGIGLVSYTITHHTRQSAVGLPFIKEKSYAGKTYSVTEYTMSEIIASVYEKIEQTQIQEGILFIDEINCVSETLAPAMLQFLQCKTFGNQRVPKGWIIVAAGNPPEYNKSVREFDVVTLDRIKKIDVEENYEVWKEYAYQAEIHPAIMAYLELKQDAFYRIETTVDGKVFVTARGWEDLSELLKVYETLGKETDREVVHQYIQHWKIAKEFANYLRLYEKYKKDYGLEKILEGIYSKEILEQLSYAPFDERFSVVSMLSGRLGEQFREACVEDRYVTMLYDYARRIKTEGSEAIIKEAAAKYEMLRKAERLTRLDERIFMRVLDMLEQYEPQKFEAAVKKRQQLIDDALEMLNHAFEFLEAAFGDSQEMVIFITELNTGYYSVWFVDQNGCDRYYKYNKSLLFAERQKGILTELDALEELEEGTVK